MRNVRWILIFFMLFYSCIGKGCSRSFSKVDGNTLAVGMKEDDLTSVEKSSQEGELLKIYSLAISQFIALMQEKDNIKLDTLFINKRKNNQPDDFPEIKLAAHIKGCAIILVEQGDAKAKNRVYTRSTPFINLIGLKNEDEFEFIFVSFYPEFHHAYDCYITYQRDKKTGNYDVKATRIEVLVYDKQGKPDHYEVFEKGKPTRNKPIH